MRQNNKQILLFFATGVMMQILIALFYSTDTAGYFARTEFDRWATIALLLPLSYGFSKLVYPTHHHSYTIGPILVKWLGIKQLEVTYECLCGHTSIIQVLGNNPYDFMRQFEIIPLSNIGWVTAGMRYDLHEIFDGGWKDGKRIRFEDDTRWRTKTENDLLRQQAEGRADRGNHLSPVQVLDFFNINENDTLNEWLNKVDLPQEEIRGNKVDDIEDEMCNGHAEGFDAFNDGTGLESNPYDKSSPKHDCWYKGWSSAAESATGIHY